jgi:hypothetical protein
MKRLPNIPTLSEPNTPWSRMLGGLIDMVERAEKLSARAPRRKSRRVFPVQTLCTTGNYRPERTAKSA